MTSIRARVPITNAKDFAFSVAHGNNTNTLVVDFIELDAANNEAVIRGTAWNVARALSFFESAGVLNDA
jgi:hypothetical protein